MKEKIKAFYILNFINQQLREIIKIKKDEEINGCSTNKNTNNYISEENSCFFENMYIFKLIQKNKISIEKMNVYHRKLCDSILTDASAIGIMDFHIKSYSVENIKMLIKKVINFQVLSCCINFIKNNKNLNNSKLEKIQIFINENKELFQTKFCQSKTVIKSNSMDNSTLNSNRNFSNNGIFLQNLNYNQNSPFVINHFNLNNAYSSDLFQYNNLFKILNYTFGK
jgi:hypothetical protein